MPSETDSNADLEFLKRVFDGDSAALRQLVVRFTPVVQSRCAWTLYRRSQLMRHRDLRQELEDTIQEVFAAIVQNQFHVLRAWRPEAGLSLDGFVGMIATRQVLNILRSDKRSPWRTEDLVDDIDVPQPQTTTPVDGLLASKQALSLLLDRLRQNLSPRMMALFEALWVDEKSVEEICREFGMTTEAVYTARSRIASTARALGSQIAGDI